MRRSVTRSPGLVLAIAGIVLLGLVAIPLRTIAQDATTTPEAGGLQISSTPTPTEATSAGTPSSGGLIIGPTPAGTPATGVHGHSYTSPTYGFTLSWSSRWHVMAEASENGVDELSLSDGSMVVAFATTVDFQGNATRCRDATVAKMKTTSGISNVKPATDPNGKPLAGTEATRVWAVYLYDIHGAAKARYLDCRVLVPDKVNLVITADVALDKFNTESANLVALLDKLSIPSTGQGATPVATAPETPAPTEAATAIATEQLPPTEVATAAGTTGPLSTPVFPVQETATPGPLPTEPIGPPQPQPTGTEDLSALGVRGNTYKSPNYGYTLKWDSSWTVGDANSSRGGSSGIGFDQLTLYNDASVMTITGAEGFNGNAQQCVQGVANELKQSQSGVTISDFAIATGSDHKPLQGGNAKSAWAVYLFTATQNGQSQKFANYIECHTLVPGQAVVAIVQNVAQSDYNDQIAPREKLTDSLKIPTIPGGATAPATATTAG